LSGRRTDAPVCLKKWHTFLNAVSNNSKKYIKKIPISTTCANRGMGIFPYNLNQNPKNQYQQKRLCQRQNGFKFLFAPRLGIMFIKYTTRSRLSSGHDCAL